jgi:prepilin-type N-terminal cleavage/methylation domain-containing protein
MRCYQSEPRVATDSRKKQSTRAGFTLIELLIVISIIGILIALLLPAVSSVFGKAKEAKVRAEITGLGNAVDGFKGSFNVHPPSSITLYENGAAWTANNATANASRAAIKQIWGLEFNFALNRNFNAHLGDTDTNDTITLTGSECLVFFLGGMPSGNSTSGWILNGFSKSKANPLRIVTSGQVRFFTEWDTGRLKDSDGDGFPEYSDIFNESSGGKPYLYISTTRTGSYPTGSVLYHQGNTNNPWKAGAFQIISPGRDHEYGSGGKYTEATGANRANEKDNITNFSAGVLGP